MHKLDPTVINGQVTTDLHLLVIIMQHITVNITSEAVLYNIAVPSLIVNYTSDLCKSEIKFKSLIVHFTSAFNVRVENYVQTVMVQLQLSSAVGIRFGNM